MQHAPASAKQHVNFSLVLHVIFNQLLAQQLDVTAKLWLVSVTWFLPTCRSGSCTCFSFDLLFGRLQLLTCRSGSCTCFLLRVHSAIMNYECVRMAHGHGRVALVYAIADPAVAGAS